jgi:hypothetical protein
LLESEVAQISTDHFRKFRRRFRAQFSQSLARLPQVHLECSDLVSEPLQFFIASFNFPHSLGRPLAKSDNFRNCCSVFSFQRLKERDPLLEAGQLLGIEIEILGVAAEIARNLR